MTDQPRVLGLYVDDEEVSLSWRLFWPLDEIRKHGVVADYAHFNTNFNSSVLPRLRDGTYNIVVTPRVSWNERWMMDYFASALQKADVAWCYDADDDIFTPHIVDRNVYYGLLMTATSRSPTDERAARIRVQADYMRQERIRALGLVDGLTVSTPPLAELAANYCARPIEVVPNGINEGWFVHRLDASKRQVPPLSIGWSGGWREAADLEVMIEAWLRLAARFPDLHFVLHGYADSSFVGRFDPTRLHVLEWTDFHTYPSLLKNIDIGCCSVADTRWNANKSLIKWYEMTLAGAAVVGSHALYGREITDGADGLLATTAEEWEDALARLILDPTLRQAVQHNALDTVRRTRTIGAVWPQWLAAWRTILGARTSAFALTNSA